MTATQDLAPGRMPLQECIKGVRCGLEVEQDAIAAELGIDRATLGRIENMVVPVTPDYARRIIQTARKIANRREGQKEAQG